MNSDPRRPEKVQRFVPKNGNGNEDLTPDYMNILGQTTATTSTTTTTTTNSSSENQDLNQSNHLNQDDDTSHSNVIPSTPQYGVAIIPTDGGIIAQPAAITQQPPQIVDDNNKVNSDDNKDIQTTNRNNDRFKVVKIASLEPFKRGRWKCMDYMDDAPPAGTIRIPQSTGGNIQLPYMQTQSLPQQQIQQMLQATQFFAPATQILPQGQFFYPQNQQQQIPSTMPAQFIANQTYFPMVQNAGNFIPQNVQYVPIPNQNSAFVPTTQNVQLQQGFQQQGQNFNNQQQQNVVNGFATGQQKEQQVLQQQKSVVNSPSQQLVQNYQNYQQPVATVTPMQVQQQQQIVQQQIPQQQQQETSQQVENNELAVPETGVAVTTAPATENGENDTTTDKTNPVVNAIDNKIEQAMDLVKSHLMYTVREEVEVLKEKIAELMERIQQLESENNFLRAQIPKSQNLPPAPNYITNVAQQGNGASSNASVASQSAGNVAAQQAAQHQQANVADSSVKSQGQGQ